MTTEKFEHEVNTIHKFIQTYCNDKHKEIDKITNTLNLKYKNKTFHCTYTLCTSCESILKEACNNLLSCPHEIKPRCRQCKNPCYEKNTWKQVAKIMKYSGMKLGLIKITNRFKKLFQKS